MNTIPNLGHSIEYFVIFIVDWILAFKMLKAKRRVSLEKNLIQVDTFD